MTGIRVLRVIEYIYSDAAKAEEDMARWTLQHSNSGMIMRSATLPFEAIPFREEERPVPVVMIEHHEPVVGIPDMTHYDPQTWQAMSHEERMDAITVARESQGMA